LISILGTLIALEALFATMRYINLHLHLQTVENRDPYKIYTCIARLTDGRITSRRSSHTGCVRSTGIQANPSPFTRDYLPTYWPPARTLRSSDKLLYSLDRGWR